MLESGGVRLSINGSPLDPPEIPTSDRREFRIRAAGTTLEGWCGIVDVERRGPALVPGMRCYKLGRLIAQGEFFGHPNPGQHAGMARLIGEVEIRPVALTMNKSDFDRDSAGWVAVEERLHRALAPLVKRLRQEDQLPPPPGAVKVAEQVRRLLSQALKLAENAELFPGAAPATPRVEDAQPQLPLEEVPPAAIRAVPAAAPRPPAPQRPRRRGFGDIVIRQLDPSIRSQTETLDGVKMVVINSRYPLFVERKGDVWYQLETAAREICRSIEGVSVAEYESRVNEIVQLGFKIRQRPRRTGERAAAQLKLMS